MKTLIYTLCIILASMTLFTGCKKEIGPTAVKVEDSIRHYHPIISGDKIYMSYKVKNIGSSPLIINDVQPSCGCILDQDSTQMVVYPGDSCLLHFIFNSTENLGYVKHTIRIYANALPHGEIDLNFDLYVVPKETDSHDFEQIYDERIIEEASKDIHDNFDEANGNRGYWVKKEDDY
ncbi:DUF1573 domain-containing protein [Prevotella cerevisiae]|uniref:DUF1573 domain-containing protein n=1 Tax=Segatella cerevisiae TaxID=2053716 RepID=A0ABT1BZY0_9BACT|nr:DUF1573 domain-containing protein [Segatella cerevisiae]MCO6026632.1 DUF1573 domain-containing protein [Segatella cerevisiae]